MVVVDTFGIVLYSPQAFFLKIEISHLYSYTVNYFQFDMRKLAQCCMGVKGLHEFGSSCHPLPQDIHLATPVPSSFLFNL
jgi:hypothetical protein